MSLITLGVKRTRKLLAGNPHEQFDVAGAGNGLHGAPRLPSTLPTATTALIFINQEGSVLLSEGGQKILSLDTQW